MSVKMNELYKESRYTELWKRDGLMNNNDNVTYRVTCQVLVWFYVCNRYETFKYIYTFNKLRIMLKII